MNSTELVTLLFDAGSGFQSGVYSSNSNNTNGGFDEFGDITKDYWGSYYVTGTIQNGVTGNDIKVFKLDSNLNVIWTVDFNDSTALGEKSCDIRIDKYNRNVYVSGTIQTTASGRDYLILAFDSSGNFISKKQFNGEANGDDIASSMENNIGERQ